MNPFSPIFADPRVRSVLIYGYGIRESSDRRGRAADRPIRRIVLLVRLATLLLARPLSSECLLRTAPIAGLQIEGVLLDILDDIFLLNLPFEAAKRALDGLAVLHFHFSHAELHPLRGRLE